MASIAILGATGLIGKSLAEALAGGGHVLVLHARAPERLTAFAGDLEKRGGAVRVADIAEFGQDEVDVVINAIGAGDPARLRDLGAGILRLTETFDNKVLDYLEARPGALYLNMSSGAVYGTSFDTPAHADSLFTMPVNDPGPAYAYAVAKINAEAKHRGADSRNIVDLRVFSYISRHIDLGGRFFMADLARALVARKRLATTPADMVRDFVGPADMARLVECCIERWRQGPVNAALDVYSQAPASKFEILAMARDRFDLDYEVLGDADTLTTTGEKSQYYSRHRAAADWGYLPTRDSLETVAEELTGLFESLGRT